MTTASTVLILGARGRFGQAAARAFARAGWQVLGQVRPGAQGPAIAGVHWLALQPSDTAALAKAAGATSSAAARGAAVVVNALNPVYTHKAWRAEAPALLESAIRISQVLDATLMMPGNVYNFGESMPALLREGAAQQATGVKGRIRIAMEQRLQAATQDGSLRAVVIRAGDFFGSGTGSWLDQAVAKDLARGRVTWPGPLDVATPWAYLPDLARSFVKVAQQRSQLDAFAPLHFAGHTVTGQQWVDALTSVAWEQGWLPADGRLRVSRMPWPLLRVAGLVLPTLAALADMRYLWRTPHQLDNQNLCALIGDEPRTPFDDAVRQSLNDLGLLTRPVTGAKP
jgi:nucleoside-diphosphate-sugar epimerase